MNSKAEATIKGIQDLSGEVGAFEMRLTGIKSEVSSLTRQRDDLKKTMEEMRTAFNLETERKHLVLRGEADKFNEIKNKFEADKAEFQGILTGFKKEKAEFEKVKTDTLDTKANYQKMYDRVSRFIVLVRRESELL